MRQEEVIHNTLKAKMHSFKPSSKPTSRQSVFVTEPPPSPIYSPSQYATVSPISSTYVKPTKKATTASGKPSRHGKSSRSLPVKTILCVHSPQSFRTHTKS